VKRLEEKTSKFEEELGKSSEFNREEAFERGHGVGETSRCK
jgi:hypothetical protein